MEDAWNSSHNGWGSLAGWNASGGCGYLQKHISHLSAYTTVDSRSTLIWSACFIAWAKS